MKFIIAKKIEMTQVFTDDGIVVPVTVLQAGPVTVTQRKAADKHGYSAVQVGFGTRKAKNITKSVAGHTKDLGSFQTLKEFRVSVDEQFERGQKIAADVFAVGDTVDVVGTSIGRGFAGVVKRHGFHGAPASHGHKDQSRMPGSIGSKRQGPVAKGKRMGGHMGAARVTVKNIAVVAVDVDNNRLLVKGAVPGAIGAIVTVQSAKNSR